MGILWVIIKHLEKYNSFVFLVAATQATYTRPTVSPNIGARISASSGGATYVKTTSGSIITVVPKSLATLGGKIISSNIVSGKTS